MQYAEIIKYAWDKTLKRKKLIFFAFVPTVFSIVIFIYEVLWQYSWVSEEFDIVKDGTTWNIIKNIVQKIVASGFMGLGVALLILLIVFGFVLPPLIRATLIESAKHDNIATESSWSLRQKIHAGGSHFFSLFELFALLKPFEFMTISFFVVTLFRYFHGDIFNFIFPFIIVYSFFAILLNLFFSFSPFYIVCDGESVSSAFKKSFGLVFVNFGKTLGLFLVSFLINFNVLLNIFLIFAIPFGIIALAGTFASALIMHYIVVIVGIGSLILLWVASYFISLMIVFYSHFWTKAFFELKNIQADLESLN